MGLSGVTMLSKVLLNYLIGRGLSIIKQGISILYAMIISRLASSGHKTAGSIGKRADACYRTSLRLLTLSPRKNLFISTRKQIIRRQLECQTNKRRLSAGA